MSVQSAFSRPVSTCGVVRVYVFHEGCLEPCGRGFHPISELADAIALAKQLKAAHPERVYSILPAQAWLH